MVILFTLVLSSTPYALVVGANDGGSGQDKLRFAESDAQKVGDVLVELGGVEHLRVLKQPTSAELAQALDELDASLPADAVVYFYFSGHAKANALSLGDESFELTTLRARLDHMRTQVKVVVLDACQSGAFARVKGSVRAADFSYNSIDRLNVSGTAVLASSSASELSQEAEETQGSYFTHHLVAALRGAADHDDDGRVTLEETYKYAYARTLEDTTRTRVGAQHVTFETALAGQGGLALTTTRARQRLLLPKALSARVLLIRGSNVLADVRKASGESFGVNVPSGFYRVTVRTPEQAYACGVNVKDDDQTQLDLSTCTKITESTTVTKQTLTPPPPFALEFGFGIGQQVEDSYDARLKAFSMTRVTDAIRPHLSGVVLWNALPFLSVMVEAMELEQAMYRRAIESPIETNRTIRQGYNWTTFGVATGLRATLWLVKNHVNPYAQLSIGAAFANATYKQGVEPDSYELNLGLLLHPAIGCNFMFVRRFGMFAQLDWYYATPQHTAMGEVHQSGGIAGQIGFRVGL